MRKGYHRRLASTLDENSRKEFERQQPIIKELVARFNAMENKRESFRKSLARPELPKTPKIQQKKTRPILTMETALADPGLRTHFREFIEAAFAAENLDFWESIEKYFTLSDAQKIPEAKRIINEFVVVNATSAVNLPSELSRQLLNITVEAKNLEEVTKLLDQAQHEILTLMQSNFFDKFLSVVGQPAELPEEDDEEEKEEDKHRFFKDWIQKRHPKTGDNYYVNPDTGVSMWDIPKPILPPPLSRPEYF